MISFLVRRSVAAVITLWAIATLSFLICRFSPGSPFTSERNVPPEVLRNMERKYGLDRPLAEQYLKMMAGYVQGDLGPSYKYPDKDVVEFIEVGLPVSIRLGAVAFVIAVLFGLTMGIVAARYQNRWPDYVSMSTATLGICVPNFLLGPLLVLIFYYGLGWVDPTGWPEEWTSWSELQMVILPALTLALVHVAYLSRLTRAGMLDVLHKDFIRTARAKGVSERSVFLKHALKNGIVPAMTYAGPMAAYLVTGSLVVEKVFNIPGLGQYFINAAINRDYGLVMGVVLVYSGLVIFFNIVVDLMYAVLDPRVRLN